MADKKISALPASTTPLAGTEVLPIVQSGVTKQVSVANLTDGRAITATKFTPTGGAVTGNGMWLPAANTVAVSTNGTEVWRANSSQQLLVKATTNKTGGGFSANQGLGVQNDATAFASVEHGSGAAGTFTTITVSFTRNDTSGSVIIETLMTGFSGVYLDNVIGLYGNQTPVTMRNNASGGTSAALTLDVTNLICTLTITTSVIHPVIKAKCTVGGLATTTSLPTFTFA